VLRPDYAPTIHFEPGNANELFPGSSRAKSRDPAASPLGFFSGILRLRFALLRMTDEMMRW